MKCSELGPLAGTDDKIVCWTAPVPNASHKAPGIKTHILSHIHTEHRPHAAPKGQEETLIRGQGSSSESETASMGAEEPEQAGLTSAPRRANLGPLSWKGVRWTPGGPYGQKFAWLLGPAPRPAPAITDSALVPNQCSGHFQAGLRRLVEGPHHLSTRPKEACKTARKNCSLKFPSLPTWGGSGKIVAFWLQARPDHSDQ